MLTLSSCSSAPPAPTVNGPSAGTSTDIAKAAVADGNVPALDRAGWTESVYKTLTEAIIGSAGQGKIVVFGFDNTTQARDIGEAVLAQVQQAKVIDPASLSTAMFPPFTTSDGKPMSITEGISDYYDAVLDSAGEADPFREYSSLPMPATAFTGRTVADFLAQTAAVYDDGAGAADLKSTEQSKILGAGRPFTYPQMADLYGNLRSNGYDVWVVSAGVGWAVRWMVQNAVNPAIVAKYGDDAALPMDHVVAITTLLRTAVPENCCRTAGHIGIDRGVKNTVVTSDSEFFQAPSLTDGESRRFAALQQKMSRQRKGSRNRGATKAKLSVLRQRPGNRRREWIEQTTTELALRHPSIAIEKLLVRNMVRRPKPKPDPDPDPDPDNPGNYLPNGANAKAALNKAILASCWGNFAEKLSDKTDVIEVLGAATESAEFTAVVRAARQVAAFEA